MECVDRINEQGPPETQGPDGFKDGTLQMQIELSKDSLGQAQYSSVVIDQLIIGGGGPAETRRRSPITSMN